MSGIPSTGSIDVRSNSQSDFLLIQKKCGERLIYFPSNMTNVLKWVLCSLNTLGKQRQLLSSVDCLHSDVQTSVTHIRSLERRPVVPRAAKDSGLGEVALLKQALDVTQRQLSTVHLSLPTVEANTAPIVVVSILFCKALKIWSS